MSVLRVSHYERVKQSLGTLEALPEIRKTGEEGFDQVNVFASTIAIISISNKSIFGAFVSGLVVLGNYLVRNANQKYRIKSQEYNRLVDGLKQYSAGTKTQQEIRKIFEALFTQSAFEETALEVNQMVFDAFYKISLLGFSDQLENWEADEVKIKTNLSLVHDIQLLYGSPIEEEQVGKLRQEIQLRLKISNPAKIIEDKPISAVKLLLMHGLITI